jgi:hypothetical protein
MFLYTKRHNPMRQRPNLAISESWGQPFKAAAALQRGAHIQ